jgi:hypothetical protein
MIAFIIVSILVFAQPVLYLPDSLPKTAPSFKEEDLTGSEVL